MPLVFVAYVALIVGCALGAAPLAPSLWLAGIVGGAAAIRRDARAVALAAIVATGMLASHAASSRAAACRDAALATQRIDVVVAADVRAGERVGANGACGVRASLAVAHGRARAGEHVRALGTVLPGARGLVVRDATITASGRRAPLVAWRARIGREIDALFEAEAPLVRALVVADQRDVARDVRDRFADAGLVHLLSVSGLHVALVATTLELLLLAARLSRRTASVASVAAVSWYVLLIGAPAPAVRAGSMLVAHLASRISQRPTSPWAVLALGGVVPLLGDATLVGDAGYQLSMAGMAALVGGRALARRLLDGRLDGWRLRLGRELVVGTIASLVTAPIVAWWFSRASLVGPLANLVAGPIVTVLQPTLFLAVALAPLRPLALLPAAAGRVMLRALDAVAARAAAVPHASVDVGASIATTVLGAAAVTALLAWCAARTSRWRGRAGVATTACAAAIAWWPMLPRAAGHDVELHMLDVGQGDAVALRTPRGRWVLFDAGRVWRGGDAGRATILPFLRHDGGALAAFVLSHPHADHVGGAPTVLAALAPDVFWDAGFALGSDVYRAALDSARAAGVRWHRVRPDDSLDVDGVVLRALAPDSAWTASLDDPNLASVVVSVRYGAVRFLLVGDAEAREERWLLDRVASGELEADALRADVLKVAHHGSRTSSTQAFLDAVRPRLGLVSVGAGNSYHLPNEDVLMRLRHGGAEVLRTDQWGPIVVRTDGRTLRVIAGGETWSVGSRAR